jgi:tripartite-type tricarboxylate transporter receptor subunit TctC
MIRLIAGFSVALTIVAGSLQGAAQADELDALQGKTIRFMIGGPPQGGTDNYARPLVDAMKKLLPSTTVLAQTVAGGAGAMALTEAQSATGSSITVIVIHNSPIYSQMMKSEIGEFDLTKFHWIGAMANNQRLALVPKILGKTTVDELRSLGRQPIALADNAGTPGYIESILISGIADLKMKVVSGVEEEQRDAYLLGGNADFTLNSYVQVKSLLESGDFVPLLRMGNVGYPAELDKVPTLREVAPADAPIELVELMESLNVMGRLVAAAPNTEPAAVEALRAAFDRIVADPETIALYKGRDLALAPTGGAELGKRIEAFLGEEKARKLLSDYMDCGKKISDGTAQSCKP